MYIITIYVHHLLSAILDVVITQKHKKAPENDSKLIKINIDKKQIEVSVDNFQPPAVCTG